MRCDKVQHCEDSSDEEDCGMIEVPSIGYDASVPPVTKEVIDNRVTYPNIDVEVLISVMKIFVINEVDSIISILFNMSVRWSDPLLLYHYLKEDQLKNAVRKNDSNNIWKPKLDFSIVQDDPKELKRHLFLKKKGKPLTKRDDFSLAPKEIFTGKENEIEMILHIQAIFICPYDDITN